LAGKAARNEVRRRSGSYADRAEDEANAARRAKSKPNGPVAQLARAHD
jgi:hypothetical protein